MSATSSKSIRASVLHGPKDLRLESRDIAEPGCGEVQVAVQATGICGSDLHYYHHYRNGDILVREPLSLGHESVGVVTAVGPGDVSGLTVGDRIALEVGLPCGKCDRCTEGRYNICAGMNFRSSAKAFPHAQGTLQDLINHPATWCHKIPDDLPSAVAALSEPLSVAIHATRRAALAPGATVLVIGAGAVGLLVAAMCRLEGATTVVICDIEEGRVNFATTHRFADRSFVIGKGGPPRDDIEKALAVARNNASQLGDIERTTGGKCNEFDATFECTGVPESLRMAIYATRPGGKVMLIGMGTPIQTLPISAAALREVDLCGVFRYANAYPASIKVLSSSNRPGDPDFASLVTHTFNGLDLVGNAFGMAVRKTDDEGRLVLKVVVTNE